MKPLFASVLLLVTLSAMADEKLKSIACRSVHLGYPSQPGTVFYNEVAIEQTAPGTYFMVCGWDKGYFGMQELANSKKLILFSVWDSNQNDAKNVPDEKRTKLLYKDDKVRIGRFGGEGTGGQSFFDYDWKPSITYRFMVVSRENGDRTEYTGYFFHPETNAWKKLVTFSTFTGGKPMRGFYSFVEDFKRDRASTTKVRQARFGKGWIRLVDGKWQPIEQARFTADSNPIENIYAGLSGNEFILATGGNSAMKDVKLKDTMKFKPAGLSQPPKDVVQVLESTQ
ncbi:MAG TPA: DUF3472 domain-containing protein [Gemmatales bacterium]|nr:DUF3472 domain-containing protein [Gemmatales bacterium]